MDRWSNRLYSVVLAALCFALICCLSDLVHAACKTANCSDKCRLFRDWCLYDKDVNKWSLNWFYEVNGVAPPIGLGCTNGNVKGTGGIEKFFDFLVYKDCVAHCDQDTGKYSTCASLYEVYSGYGLAFWPSECKTDT